MARNTQEVRFAVVGLGMGAMRAKLIAQTEGARLTAVCDLDEERLRAVSEEHGCAAVRDYQELLARDDVDVVMVMTPSGTHGKFAIEAARAGKHVITTKPMELTFARCQEMIQAAKEAGVFLAVDFESRYYPAMRQIRRAITEGLLGRPILFEARCKWYRDPSYYTERGGWRGTWRMDGGGPLANQSIHLSDLMLWMMGDPEWILADVARLRHQIETEDLGLCIVGFPGGARGLLIATTDHVANDSFGIEVTAEKGSVSLLWFRGEPKWSFLDKSVQPPPVPPGPNNVIEDMVQAVQNGRPPLLTGEEGARTAAFLERVYDAAGIGAERRRALEGDSAGRAAVGR